MGVSAEPHVPPALPLRNGPIHGLGGCFDLRSVLDAVGKNFSASCVWKPDFNLVKSLRTLSYPITHHY
jgi:hypothetical protein